MDFLEMTPDQIKECVAAGTPEGMLAYMEEQGITLPEKAPVRWPAATEKFTRMIWQKIKFPAREVCAEGEHDYQPVGTCEMERTEATMPGSSFRRAFQCTKCGAVRWVSDTPVFDEGPAA